MVDFLFDESADFFGQLGRGAVAVGFDRLDEEGLAAREGGGQGIVPGSANRIALDPPARRLDLAPETSRTVMVRSVGVGTALPLLAAGSTSSGMAVCMFMPSV
jgi:hypothetical protein